MKKILYTIGLAIVMGLAVVYASVAATYYMGGPGDDFSSFREAFRGPNAMKGGDTLIIRDGFYDGIDNQYCPPSGTPENYTIVKAEHDGKAVLGIGMSTSSIYGPAPDYIQYEGIKYATPVGGGAGRHHFKYLRCIFEGHIPDSEPSPTIATGWTQHHVLFEDCIAYGKGRYKFLIYGSQYVVLRRCIARMDYGNATWSDTERKHEQIAGFSMYDSANVELQNCMVIDSDQPQFIDNMAPQVDAYFGPGYPEGTKLRGCININNPALNKGCNVQGPGTASENSVFWGHGSRGLTTAEIEHNTVGNFDQPEVSIGIGGCCIAFGDPLTAYNNIVIGANIALDHVHSKHNLLWDNQQDYQGVYSTEGDITDVNPFYHPTENPQGGLKYLVRIEPNSNLSGKATDGGDIGANILKRIGRSGTLWGEPGWDEVTNEDLWPWPNEDLIKEHMGNYNGGGVDPNLPRGDRGFCAYVSPFGSPNTLTSYIWEYLGNPIPPEIYGQNPNPNSPPIAYDQQVETHEDTSVAITLTGSDPDGDPLTYIVLVNPTKGTLSGTAPNLTYTPDTDYSGSDSFTFKVNDGIADSNIATVSITVDPVNDPPLAYDQSVTTNEDVPVSITLTASNPDGDPLTYIVMSDPPNGSLSGTAPSLTYKPDPDFSGDDLFTFRVNDGVVDSNTATVSITVNGPPGKPIHVDLYGSE